MMNNSNENFQPKYPLDQIRPPIARMSTIAPSLDSVSASRTSDSNLVQIELDNMNKQKDFANHSNSLSDTKAKIEEPNIPDGGWGWIVVFATFILCMIADGVTFSFGLLYGEFLKEFEASNSATSWIGSLFMSIPLLTGPIMSALVEIFGCRAMTIVGGVISASGFVLSSHSNSLGLMYVTFGIWTGIGLGLIYVTVVVSVSFWFDKKRTLAVGIGSSGIGIGTFVFSPLLTYLLGQFGWRGTTFILGGCFLNMCVCGALMRDPDWIIKQNRQAKICKNRENKVQETVNIDQIKAYFREGKHMKTNQELEHSLEHSQDKDPLSFTIHKHHLDDKDIRMDIDHTKPFDQIACYLESLEEKPFIRRSTYHGKYRDYIRNNNYYADKASSCPNFHGSNAISLEVEQKTKSKAETFLEDLLDFSLFLELHFFLLSLSTVIFFTWFIVPYFYLAELMTQIGYSAKEISFTISNIGISNTIGLLVLGWLGDRSWMNITMSYGIFLIICGLSTAGQMFFIDNYILLQLCAFIFGVSMSSHFAFTPGIVMELVPLDRFTLAYGLQLLCQGIGTLGGPPYAGFLIDATNSFDQSFYQAAIWIVLSGIFVILISFCKNRRMIGKGPVEKSVPGDRNRPLALMVLCIMTFVSFIIIFYLIATAILTYKSKKLKE